MAKDGIDGFFLNCQLDEKFELIEAEFGLKGFAIIIKLLQRIYGEHGYYCEYNSDISLLLAAKWNVASSGGDADNLHRQLPTADNSSVGGCHNLIDHVVVASIRRGIFDKTMYENYGILTSKGIQKRYITATRKRVDVVLKNEYLLLNDVINGKTDGRNGKTDGSFEQSKVKESKVNNKDNICAPEPHDHENDREEQLLKDFEIIYALYPKKRGKTVAFANYKQWVSKTGKDVGGKRYHLTNRQIYIAVKKYIRQQEEAGQDDYQYWKNFDTLMGRQLLDYVDWEDNKK